MSTFLRFLMVLPAFIIGAFAFDLFALWFLNDFNYSLTKAVLVDLFR